MTGSTSESAGEGNDAAVSALSRLGLTGTQARLLLGLARLGSATAREIAEATDVPRSQVYGTADELEEMGLVYVQHANPQEYHAVSPDEVGSMLCSRFERDLETATDRLEELERTRTPKSETREEIWTVRGRTAIDGRVAQLLGGAQERVLLGVRTDQFLTADHTRVLEERAAAGVEVIVISNDRDVIEQFGGVAGVDTVEPPEEIDEDEPVGRLLVVDDVSVLHSVLVPDATPDATPDIDVDSETGEPQETAFWSSDSGFARMIASLMEQTLAEAIDG